MQLLKLEGNRGETEVARTRESETKQMAAACNAAKAKRGQQQQPASSSTPPHSSERLERRHRAQSFIQGKELDELEKEVETGLYENADLSHGSRTPVLLAHICFSKLELSSWLGLKGFTIVKPY